MEECRSSMRTAQRRRIGTDSSDFYPTAERSWTLPASRRANVDQGLSAGVNLAFWITKDLLPSWRSRLVVIFGLWDVAWRLYRTWVDRIWA